ncbi:MAG: tripartite tricarboxylate transporter TctB family protein [Thalassobaculum sp.]|uniref:tripartite tricarboxylate transporter TctB family protein n=1 Tax=Thalassobaculum sp. TaxID=2022740 RepID=UPI0032EC5A16
MGMSPGEGGAAAPAARFPRDLLVACAILAFCAVAYGITLGFAKAPAAVAQNVQPATFPRLVIAVIAVLSGVLALMSFRADSARKRPVRPMVVATAVMMVAFVIAFDILGFIAAMVLFAAAMPLLWGERRWRLVLPFAVLFPAAIYLVFVVGLGVHFDPGLLGIN